MQKNFFLLSELTSAGLVYRRGGVAERKNLLFWLWNIKALLSQTTKAPIGVKFRHQTQSLLRHYLGCGEQHDFCSSWGQTSVLQVPSQASTWNQSPLSTIKNSDLIHCILHQQSPSYPRRSPESCSLKPFNHHWRGSDPLPYTGSTRTVPV